MYVGHFNGEITICWLFPVNGVRMLIFVSFFGFLNVWSKNFFHKKKWVSKCSMYDKKRNHPSVMLLMFWALYLAKAKKKSEKKNRNRQQHFCLIKSIIRNVTDAISEKPEIMMMMMMMFNVSSPNLACCVFKINEKKISADNRR